ncbi:DUF3891 family protein [Anaerobacillus sp. CMMVII]|uniref:DUF3891 family protein n=1 Tax=Anaerobacillus sp. CMMVII TaxID=2755588 RepID=UPI0021B82832|nr:DUF3891 family protein [Anaerobacillus sp. CMMVII]MCT8137946.1 DUF3891 family protein [Anaerobacillus sp. CMMVII]
MVVTERRDEILLFEQHEHAKVCGEFAQAWKDEYFDGNEKRESVLYAIYEHDNGWIELDQRPLLNKETKLPHSFIDYPLSPKLEAYTKGINYIEQHDEYAALICSLHYASFFERYTNGRGEVFLAQERKRQRKLLQVLTVEKETLQFHYDLLQFCDNLSLYLCMNEPGVDKKNEFSWFKRGFQQRFHFNQKRRIIAHWLDKNTVSVEDFPFSCELTVSMGYKKIKKNRILSLEKEYEAAENQQRVITLVGG